MLWVYFHDVERQFPMSISVVGSLFPRERGFSLHFASKTPTSCQAAGSESYPLAKRLRSRSGVCTDPCVSANRIQSTELCEVLIKK